MSGEGRERRALIRNAPDAGRACRTTAGHEPAGRIERDAQDTVVRDSHGLSVMCLGRHVPQVEPLGAAGRQQRAVRVEGHGEHRSGARHDLPPHRSSGAHVPELYLALPLLGVEAVTATIRIHDDREQPTVRAERHLPDGCFPACRAGSPQSRACVGSKSRTRPSIVPTATCFPSGAKATDVTIESTCSRRACRRVAVSYSTTSPSNCPATSRVPSGLKDTSVVRSIPPSIGSPIACSPPMFQTTADSWWALTRVRPSGLNATSLTGLVSTVSADPYGSPVFAFHTKTDPSNVAAASRRPSGLRSSESAGTAADRERRPDGSSRCDVDHGHRAGVVARDQRCDRPRRRSPPPRRRSRSRAACRPGAPSRPPRSRRSRERPGRRCASSPG